MALLLGVDKFMSECRALTNICGNGVATIVVAAWEGELDREKLSREWGIPATRARDAAQRRLPSPRLGIGLLAADAS